MSRDLTSSTISPQIEARIRAQGPVLDMPFAQSIYKPLLRHQVREGVNVMRDLSYGDNARQKLDVYIPIEPNRNFHDVLIFLHGGGFIRGDKSERENFGYYFARRGHTVIVPNYRLAPAYQWPAGAEDTIAVYVWALTAIPQLHDDHRRIFLIGESAGATHVASAVLMRRFHPPQGLAIAGAVLISGVYNVQLEKLARRQFGVLTPDPRNEAYFGADFQKYPSMSIVDQIDAPPVPLLITYAELDMLQMQVQAGELFARLVTRHNFDPELYLISGHNHLTQGYAINTGDESLTRPIEDFMEACKLL